MYKRSCMSGTRSECIILNHDALLNTTKRSPYCEKIIDETYYGNLISNRDSVSYGATII